MHSRTPVGILRPGIIKDNSDAGEITRMSKKRVQTGNFSDYVPLLIEGNSYSWFLVIWSAFVERFRLPPIRYVSSILSLPWHCDHNKLQF